MAVYKRNIVDIELEQGNIHRSWLQHSIGMKDQQADHFGVRVFRNGEPVSLTGVSVQGVFMPPEGSPIAITSGNIVSGNVAEVVLPQACYNYDGQFTLAIKLVDSSNGVTDTVRIVDGMVDNTHATGTVAPTSAVPTYQEVLSAYEQAITVINKSVRFDTTQSLTDAQKTRARGNIDAVSQNELNDVKKAFNANQNITAVVANIQKINLLDRNGELDNYYWYYDGTNDIYLNYNSGAGTYAIIGPVRLLQGVTYRFNGFYGLYSFICDAGTRSRISNLQGITSYTPNEDVDLFITIKKNTASSAYVYADFGTGEFNVDDTLSVSKMPADAKAVGEKMKTVALDVNGKEPEYKYGYLQKSGGAISPASSGNNKYFVIYPLGNETYLFSGAYSDTTWPLVFGYDSAGNSSVLVTGGTKNDYKFTVPDGIVEIRGWSDTSRVDLKIVPYAVVKDTQEQLNDLDFLIRPNLVQQIGYLGKDNGAITTQSTGTNRYYQVKGLHGGERFIYSGGYQPGNTGWGLAFSFDAQGNVTKLFAGAKTGYEFTTPNGCVELRAWGDISNYPLSLVYADSVDSRLDALEGSSIPRMIVVDAGGDGEFTDIQSAINFAIANYPVSSKPVIIYVMNGIYAVSPKADSPYYAINKGSNKISIIGESRDGVIIRCTCTSELQGIALNIGGECTIENLTIENLADETYTSETILEGNHRPYCLHNDSDGEDESKKYYTTVRNCKFYSECDTPIGAGMHTNQVQRYENVECIYAEDAVIQQQGAFYLHGPYNSGFNPIGAEIVDCVFISKNSRPAVSMQNVSGTKPWSEMSQTFIRNVTYSAGSTEVSLAATSSITPQSKGNTNNTLNKQ